ncbi:MBL fold metallo-hydrolase [Thermoanaerobacterium thermosaccharolyticum]|jgi:Metallo-beta-lactamase superfamily.|uniref:MBL fold metallo-hydrolase n=1 Tax=Thermoanaerobacterium thermosaccharolyticum TaxID=1517 RepID=UPI002799E56B|nr:MBL fold metallo-hydrolase [Thermoanaerobacterium thermosaccharolyticum]
MINDINIKRFVLGPFQSNCYVLSVKGSNECVMIDPGIPAKEIEDYIKGNSFNLKYILITHGHFDHIGGVDYLRDKFSAKVCISADDSVMLSDTSLNLSDISFKKIVVKNADILLNDDDTLELNNSIAIYAIHTPGHTPGGLCYKVDGVCFSGDTLFKGSIGRTDFPGGNYSEIIDSIKNKLFVLDDDLIVCPGHGDMTTIKEEKLHNPFL